MFSSPGCSNRSASVRAEAIERGQKSRGRDAGQEPLSRRDGGQAPLGGIADPPKNPQHALSPWPTKSQWGVTCWGDLTPHGVNLVKALGAYYARTYQGKLPTGFKSFLWADNARRTRATAEAL